MISKRFFYSFSLLGLSLFFGQNTFACLTVVDNQRAVEQLTELAKSSVYPAEVEFVKNTNYYSNLQHEPGTSCIKSAEHILNVVLFYKKMNGSETSQCRMELQLRKIETLSPYKSEKLEIISQGQSNCWSSN